MAPRPTSGGCLEAPPRPPDPDHSALSPQQQQQPHPRRRSVTAIPYALEQIPLLYGVNNLTYVQQFDVKIPEDMLFPMVEDEYSIKQTAEKDMARYR